MIKPKSNILQLPQRPLDVSNSKNYLVLSQKRASSVVNALKAYNIDSSRLKAIGYGESQPIAPNKNKNGSDNPEGRAKNRRTDFKIIGTITNFGDED